MAFQVPTADSLFPERFNAKLAEGTELSVVVVDAAQAHTRSRWDGANTDVGGELTPLAIRSFSLTPEIVVGSSDGPRALRLAARHAGSAWLSATTDRGSDKVLLQVLRANRFEMGHTAAALMSDAVEPGEELPLMVLLAGGRARFRVRAFRDEQPLMGEVGVLFEVRPSDTARVAARRGDRMHLEVSAGHPGQLEVLPAAGPPFRFQVVELSEISGVRLCDNPWQKRETAAASSSPAPLTKSTGPCGRPLSIEAQKTGLGLLRIETSGGRLAFGMVDSVALHSETPDRCRINERATAEAIAIFGDGFFALDGLEPGTCSLSAAIGEHRFVFTADVTTPPASAAKKNP